MIKIRRFRVPEGRMLTLPADLTEGTGNTRVKGPETVDIEVSRIGVHARFIANRLQLGDLEEITYDANVPATAGAHLEEEQSPTVRPPVIAQLEGQHTPPTAPAAPAKKE